MAPAGEKRKHSNHDQPSTSSTKKPRPTSSDVSAPSTSTSSDGEVLFISVPVKNRALERKQLVDWTEEEIQRELGCLSDEDDFDAEDSGDDWFQQHYSSADSTTTDDEMDYQLSDEEIVHVSGIATPTVDRTPVTPEPAILVQANRSIFDPDDPLSPPREPTVLLQANRFIDHPDDSAPVSPLPDTPSPSTSPHPVPRSANLPPASARPLDTPLPKQVNWIQNNPHVPRNDFIGQGGLKIDFYGKSPYEWWGLLVTDEFLEVIVTETNRQAWALRLLNRKAHSRINLWKDLTVPEFKTFLGLLFITGIIKLPTIEMYWQRNLLKDLPFPIAPGFGLYMSRDRFLLILQSLHFAQNPATPEETRNADPLYKIKYLIDYFYEKMKSIYYPYRDLCIDESLILFRGRLFFRQYLPGKKHKYGVKIYVLTEPSGLVLRFLVYVGKKDLDLAGENHAFKVVKKLMEGYLDQGHSLFADNYYNSLSLARTLLERNTYLTGTLRSDRRDNPDFLKKKLRRGEVVSGYTTSGICALKWQDKREVRMISSEFSDEIIDVETSTQKVKKPECIAQYNDHMGGIDKQDQMLSYYPSERKTVKWYKKMGIHVFEMLLHNSISLCNQFNVNVSRSLELRKNIVEGLLLDGRQEEIPEPVTPSRFRHNLHVPMKASNAKGKTLYNRCTYCFNQRKSIRKMSCMKCTDCVPPIFLCLPECFKKWHLQNVYNN